MLNMIDYLLYDDLKLVDYKLRIFGSLENMLFEKISPDGFSSVTGYDSDVENTFTAYITKLKKLIAEDKRIKKSQK